MVIEQWKDAFAFNAERKGVDNAVEELLTKALSFCHRTGADPRDREGCECVPCRAFRAEKAEKDAKKVSEEASKEIYKAKAETGEVAKAGEAKVTELEAELNRVYRARDVAEAEKVAIAEAIAEVEGHLAEVQKALETERTSKAVTEEVLGTFVEENERLKRVEEKVKAFVGSF